MFIRFFLFIFSLKLLQNISYIPCVLTPFVKETILSSLCTLVDYKYIDILLDSQLCSLGVYVYFYASTILS